MELINQNKVNILNISDEYSISGNNKSIVINKDSEYNINIKTLSAIRKLSNLEPIKNILEYYPSIKYLNISGSFNYKELIGRKKSIEYEKYLKDKIEESLSLFTSYHTEIFPIRKQCYKNLKTVFLDNKMLECPVYDHCGVTGRTSIISGHNFLTMKKKDRKKLKSNNDCVLVEVDFKSCEPFFYLKSQGFDLKDEIDVYSWISKNYNVDFKDREKFKRGILAMLYGANEYTISKVMKVKSNKVKEIKRELGIDKLNENLNKIFDSKKFVLNYYGRPITSNNNLVNYWIQSSTVDFCSLAFYYFIKDKNVTPCFFIHDSLTFQVEKNNLENILNIKNIKDPISNISIPVEFKVLTS